jgi:phage baseplate assembly protein gpV
VRLELSTCQLTGIDENGFLAAQIDALGSGGDDESGATPDQLSHAFGFVSRPKDPEGGVGCTLFHCQAGSSERHCWLGDDPRYVAKYPPPKKGGSCQYGADGVFSNIDPETHTWTLYVPYADGKAHLITAGKDGNGDPIVELVHGDGMALTFFKSSATLKNNAGDAYLELNNSGIVINGNLKVRGAVEINGLTITAAGDVKTATGVSLMTHLHPTAMGPSGPGIPTP